MSKSTVLKFMESAKVIFYADMRYNPQKKSFDFFLSNQIELDKTHGIYFILDGDDILKIGKADGVNGLRGRVKSYQANLQSRKNDHTVDLIYTIMMGPLKGKGLKMYIYPLPPKEVEHHGYILESQMTRSLERVLSKQAKEECHSMLLSGQN